MPKPALTMWATNRRPQPAKRQACVVIFSGSKAKPSPPVRREKSGEETFAYDLCHSAMAVYWPLKRLLNTAVAL
jgi:hypothetical protein